MKIKNYLQYIWLLFAAAMVGIDRLTKWLVVSNMELNNTIHIIKVGDTEVLNIYYCLNNGAAFSKLSGQTILLIVITSIVILGLLFLMVTKRVKRPVYMAAISLIIGIYTIFIKSPIFLFGIHSCKILESKIREHFGIRYILIAKV